MATSVPSSLSFEMLSRLPANSFVLEWKEVRPDQTPQNNYWELGQRQRVRFNIRGAPNEILLNSKMFLSGSAHINVKVGKTSDNVANTDDDDLTGGAIISDWLYPYLNASTATISDMALLKGALGFFQGSRESFNAGALPWNDNQDNLRSYAVNQFRTLMANRSANDEVGKPDLESTDLRGYFNCEEFKSNMSFSNSSRGVRLLGYWPANLAYSGAEAGYKSYPLGADYAFNIPLGYYSNFVNSHSALPIGLTSSYAVNGWQIELETSDDPNTCYHPPKDAITTAQGLYHGSLVTTTSRSIKVLGGRMRDLRIVMPIIKILDPSVMSAILSLYEKQEQVAVGGIAFPLSLRINSMAYRTAVYPLVANQDSYFFRIAGTDRSVRALAWYVYNKNEVRWGTGTGNLGLGSATAFPPVCTRIETRIGSENVHDVVEDQNPNSRNVANFIAMNAKASGSLFSPFPYYQEGRKLAGGPHDRYLADNQIYQAHGRGLIGLGGSYGHGALHYGVVSFENVDRREGDYSGSFQASGKDLTNVGGIEVNMRIQKWDNSVVASNDAGLTMDFGEGAKWRALESNAYEILFIYAYDSVMEISPQGVMDVTNAVL